ncbi:MAG: NADH-quinone oxidoreductase subunit D [Frankiales bacterium]|nr:NADH-quinone oxidoreductase subunit D [Frankiales bacterium]
MSPAATREITLAVGSVALAAQAADGTELVPVELGPQHPSAHGLLRLRLTLEGDVVVAAQPLVGAMHRGAEKLFESRDYRQAMVLADRHDWLSAFGNELGIALAVERMLGMDVPSRATWARTLLAELTRVGSHLAFLGSSPVVGAESVYYLHDEREAVVAVLEEATGGRLHVMAAQVGGLKQDLPAGWLDRVAAASAVVRGGLERVAVRLADAAVRDAHRGVGVLPRDVALAHGVSGPVARASGVDLDLRRDEPYLAYAELADVLRVPLRTEGDVLARVEVLHEQTLVALDLVEACVRRLADAEPGPINVRLPKVLRAPEGHTYVWTENPLGLNGYLLVSRGEKTPWRLKLRTASFNNVSVLGALLPGQRLGDVVDVLASLFYVVGDIDK